MKTKRDAKPWCVCLLLTTVSVSAKGPFQAGRLSSNNGVQAARYPWAPSLLSWRGGASHQSNRPPPPPPPRPQGSRKQDLKSRIPPPPRLPLSNETQVKQQPFSQASAAITPPDQLQNEAHRLISPPRPKQRSEAVHNSQQRQPPPPPRVASTRTKPQRQQQENSVKSAETNTPIQKSRDKPTIVSNGSAMTASYASPNVSVKQDADTQTTRSSLDISPSSHNPDTMQPTAASKSITSESAYDKPRLFSSDATVVASPSSPDESAQRDSSIPKARVTTNDNKADVLFLVPPKEELDRISLQTALSGRPKQRQELFSNWIQLRHQHFALEKLLQSQHDVKEQMLVITQLLQELVAQSRQQQQQQQQHDSLVVHVPRPVSRRRRKVEKVRMVPRKTILSSLEELDRDLSDDEFDALIQGLQDPSEVEEVYYEYEYDDDVENWLVEDRSLSSQTTPNAEEVNAFLRESSETESWYSGVENVDPYDVYSDEYYDAEPLDEALLAAWSASDYLSAASSDNDERLDEASPAEVSMVDTETIPPPLDESNNYSWREANDEVKFAESAETDETRYQEERRRSRPQPFENASTYSVGSHVQRHQKPPPPHAETLRPPPPPPRRRDMSNIKNDPAVFFNSDGPPLEDESDALDEDELRLLEETAIGVEETGVAVDGDEDFDDDDDNILDEDDLRILQFSRWVPFSRRKNQKNAREDDNDLIVDDDIFFDATDFDDGVITDDFTDFDSEDSKETLPLNEPALDDFQEESSSDEEMLLGDSAVMETVLGQVPPPRPPPRPPVEHGAASVYPGDERQPEPPLHNAGSVQYALGGARYPLPQQVQQHPSVPPSDVGYQDERTVYPNGYHYPN